MLESKLRFDLLSKAELARLTFGVLLGLDDQDLLEQRLRVRLEVGRPWQMALTPLGSYPRMEILEPLRAGRLELMALEGDATAARVDCIDLEFAWEREPELAGAGWLLLGYQEPLWIEHLLRDRPLVLRSVSEMSGQGEVALRIGGLLLREVVLPEKRERKREVSCRFDLVEPDVRFEEIRQPSATGPEADWLSD